MRQKVNHSGGENGFSLIEAMVAILITSVALLAMGALTINVMRSDNTAKLRTVAMHIAEQQLEQWYSTDSLSGYGTPPSQTSVFPTKVGNVMVNFQLQSFDTNPISGVRIVALQPSNNAQNYVRSITVYWMDNAGQHHVTVTNLQRTMN